jgi:hypothetical protein
MEETENSALEQITDTVGDLVTGIPAPIRKNFFKAFGQLCTAAVDVPVAKLQSRADEIRAESKARIRIIEEQGGQIAKQLKVPQAYIDKAGEKFASKVVKEQINLDEIGIHAANNLKNEQFDEKPEDSTTEISDDWLNEFENYAKLKSSDEMKIIFGKILSGEVIQPGAFSIRTVRLISQLDNKAAQLFQILCSQAISLNFGAHTFDARVASLGGNASSNALSNYGLSFDNLNILHEYGLIISDYNSWMNYAPCIANEKNQVSAILNFNGRDYGLIPTDREKYDRTLKISGAALTKSGKELLNIIPKKDIERYKKAFIDFLTKKHLVLEEIKNSG